jgi:molybdate/tungstate transport system substrate-binding protein
MSRPFVVLVRRVCLGGLLLSGLALPAAAQEGRITVFNAGSLARPLREALRLWAAAAGGIAIAQENAGSLESARKLTELHKVPDLIALADEGVFPALLVPAHVTWYAAFARNEMVLAYTERSVGAAEITGANWAAILQRPGVRTGRSDPALDPNGYRTLMVTELEERRAGIPGLAARLRASMPQRYVRPKEADLVALLQAGELDYAWSYRSMAEGAGLRWVDLPPEVDLGDPGREALYATVSVQVASGRSGDSLTIRGAPILYALSVPTAAPNPAAAEAFVRWLLGPDGRAVLARNGFTVLDRPVIHGAAPAWLSPLSR